MSNNIVDIPHNTVKIKIVIYFVIPNSFSIEEQFISDWPLLLFLLQYYSSSNDSF